MEYRYIATSVAGFVQQLACCYLPHGYWFYVSGKIPPGKNVFAVDRKLIEKYRTGLSRSSRARWKAAGMANTNYIRFEDNFLLLATHGHHPFFDLEAQNIRDARHTPIKFAGYSISVAKGDYKPKRMTNGALVRDNKWHARVQISKDRYRDLKAYLLDIAPHRSAEYVAAELFCVPFEPYAPVRQQLLLLVHHINRRRESARLEPIPFSVIRYRRRIVRPFEPFFPSRTDGSDGQ